MGIIRTAFTEGRNSDVSWGESETNKQLKLLELKNHNIRILNSITEKNKNKKIQQLCAQTGNCINIFSSLPQAARNILLNSDKTGYSKKKYQIAGNVRMCMLNGHKAYGYYWKILSHNSKDEVTIKYDRIRIPKTRNKVNNFVVINLRDGSVTHATKITSVSNIVGESVPYVKHILYDTTGYGATINDYIIENKSHFERIGA